MVLRFFANFRVGNFQLLLPGIANSYLNRRSNIHVTFHRVFNMHCIYHIAIF